MKLAYKLYYLSRLLLADTKLTGVRLTYEARFMKVKKFKNAIKRAIGLGYLGEQKATGKGDHHSFQHISWLGEKMTFNYDQGKKGEVDRPYVDNFIMLCAKVKTVLDKAKQKNIQLPLMNKEGKKMNFEEYEKYFGITKQIAQQNVAVVVKELF